MVAGPDFNAGNGIHGRRFTEGSLARFGGAAFPEMGGQVGSFFGLPLDAGWHAYL